MTFEEMSEIYLDYGLDLDTWKMFMLMAQRGLIESEVRESFVEKFGALCLDLNNENVIDCYSGEIHYTRCNKTRKLIPVN